MVKISVTRMGKGGYNILLYIKYDIFEIKLPGLMKDMANAGRFIFGVSKGV